MIKFKETNNPLFDGKKLDLDTIIPKYREHSAVYRPKDTWFDYNAWPSVCKADNGMLYAVSAAFSTEHACPFNKVAMYVSKNNGKTWSPPIVVVDTYVPDGHGGIMYLGDGKLIINYNAEPGDNMFIDYYYRVGMGEPRSLAKARQAMIDTYADAPAEKLIGGSHIIISEDYGFTWSEAQRMPVSNNHGICQCKDGTILFMGKECYVDTSPTLAPGVFDPKNRIDFESWDDYLARRGARRLNTSTALAPIYVMASTDGGKTWEKRGTCVLPDGLDWDKMYEPHLIELNDGTLLGSIRVDCGWQFENDYTVFLTRSTDGGYTWSKMEPTHIPGAPPHLMQHSSGKLIMTVGCRLEEDGYGEYCYVSNDNGKTWTEKYCINERSPNNDLGYPASVELDDGSVLTIYYQRYYDENTGKYDDKPCIMCTRWTL